VKQVGESVGNKASEGIKLLQNATKELATNLGKFSFSIL